MDTTGSSIEQRLRILEDREDIRELAATYCFLVDDGRFDELVERCFTEDASCDFHGAGGGMASMVSRGRAELRNFFSVMVPAVLRDMAHTVHNHRVSIDGDRASGDCYFELTAVDRTSGEAVVGAGRYLDRYRRDAGAWRFEMRNAAIFFIAPLREGWAQQRFLNALGQSSR
ncbi:MAG: nuclear transport factor 2 family protein [Candidatus Binatus sp.]|uniref:nuclear transport factor 2 family protein n=1 Tax=Candidatus Binatus sp. TaxID=2811406 RepID=UPI003C74E6C9